MKRQIKNIIAVGAKGQILAVMLATHNENNINFLRPYRSDNWVITGVNNPPKYKRTTLSVKKKKLSHHSN